MSTCHHLIQQIRQCLGCDRYICSLCEGIYSTACCNDCASQEMINESIADMQYLLLEED